MAKERTHRRRKHGALHRRPFAAHETHQRPSRANQSSTPPAHCRRAQHRDNIDTMVGMLRDLLHLSSTICPSFPKRGSHAHRAPTLVPAPCIAESPTSHPTLLALLSLRILFPLLLDVGGLPAASWINTMRLCERKALVHRTRQR